MHRTRAKLQCASDALSTPQSWVVKSEILDPDFQRIEVADSWETGRIKDGKFIVDGEQKVLGGGGTWERHHKLPESYTSNMKADPGETKNLAGVSQYDGILEDHRKLLREWEGRLDAAPETS